MSERAFDSHLYKKFASLTHPERLPNNVYVWHTPRSIVIHEEFPKSKYHFKLIPRVGAAPRVPANLQDLYTLLHSREVSKRNAEAILRDIREDALTFKAQIEEEMKKRDEFVWNIWMGFKVAPSYRYLHLHILSDDLIGSGVKKPEHFFSFHPHHGQFYHIDEVLSWFEIVPERFKDNVEGLHRKIQELEQGEGRTGQYDYDCYYADGGLECRDTFKNLKTMKQHLVWHWEKRKREALEREKRRADWAARMAGRTAGKTDDGGGQGEMEVEATTAEEPAMHGD